MSPISNNFGSATVFRNNDGPISSIINAPNGTTSFVLSSNMPYGRSASVPFNAGEKFALPDSLTRIDNPDFGCIWNPNEIKGMGLSFGSARSGKGAGLIVPALLTYAGSCVINDPKSDLAWITGKQREKFGKVAYCDPFDSVNINYASKVGQTIKTSKFNPLAHLRDDDNLTEELAGISESITIQDGRGGEGSFFFGAARDSIDGVIAGLVVSSDPGTVTFRMVRDTLTLDDEAFRAWAVEICTTYPRSVAARKLSGFTSEPNRTSQGIRETAKEQTRFLDSERLLRFLEPGPDDETFSLSELQTGHLTVYNILPPNQITTQTKWMRLMLNQSLRAVLHARVKQASRVLFLLDEAGTTLGHLREVQNAYGLTSGLGVLCWSFYQDLSQLKRDYPESWNTFFANSACFQLLKTSDLETSEYFSRYMGQTTVKTQSSSVSIGPPDLNPGATIGNVSTSTQSGEMGRAVMTDAEIRDMPEDEMLVIYPKRGNFRQFKIEYYKDARFNGMYRPDPNDQTAFPAPISSSSTLIPLEVDASTHKTKASPVVTPERLIIGVLAAALVLLFVSFSFKLTLQAGIVFAIAFFAFRKIPFRILPVSFIALACLFFLGHFSLMYGLLSLVAAAGSTVITRKPKARKTSASWWIARDGRIWFSTPPWV